MPARRRPLPPLLLALALAAPLAAAAGAARRHPAAQSDVATSVPLFPSADDVGLRYVHASVGGQGFRLLLDTNAGRTLVPSRECSSCGYPPSLPYTTGETFEAFGCGGACASCLDLHRDRCELRQVMADPVGERTMPDRHSNNSLSGFLGYDTLSIGGVEGSVPVGALLGVHGPWAERTDTDGVLGLGLAECAPTCTESVLGELEVEALVYGMCASGAHGVLDLGAVEPSRYNATGDGDLTWVDAVSTATHSVVITALSGAAVTQGEDEPRRAVEGVPARAALDTGTVFLHLPHDMYASFEAKVGEIMPPGFVPNIQCFSVAASDLHHWPKLALTFGDVTLEVGPETYLVAPPHRTSANYYCLAIFDASVSLPAGEAQEIVTLGTPFLAGHYVAVLHTGSRVRVGLARALNCPRTGAPPPRTNENTPPHDPAKCPFECRVGAGECPDVYDTADVDQCSALQEAFRPFEDLSLPNGCRGVYNLWQCAMYKQHADEQAANNCRPPPVEVSFASLCRASCEEFVRQIEECSGDVLPVCASHPVSGNCLNVTVEDPFRDEGSGCVACALDYCDSAENRVWAMSEGECAAFQNDDVESGLPASCAPVVRELSCLYYGGVGDVLKAHNCSEDSVPWDEVRLCRADCDKFVEDLRECAGDEYDAERWDSYCKANPAKDCVKLGSDLPPGTEIGNDTETGCFPCHINTCPEHKFFFGSEKECEYFKVLVRPPNEIQEHKNCTSRVREDECRQLKGYSDYVLSVDCKVDDSVKVCRAACESSSDLADECVKNHEADDCSGAPVDNCITAAGGFVAAGEHHHGGGGGGGGGAGKTAGIVIGVLVALAALGGAAFFIVKRRKAGGGSDDASRYAVVDEPSIGDTLNTNQERML